MSAVIAAETARQDDVARLLRGSEEFAHALYPPEACYLMTVDELDVDGVTVFLARIDDAAIGMAALVERGDGTAELKRMFVHEDARGRGIARRLLDAAESLAISRGVGILRLETGNKQPVAIAFYESHGYRHIPNFGQYIGDEISVCMEKLLP